MGLVTAGLTTEELQRVVPSTVDHSVRFHAAASPGEWIQLQLGAVIRQPERAVVSAQLIGEDARRLASITQTVSYRWIV